MKKVSNKKANKEYEDKESFTYAYLVAKLEEGTEEARLELLDRLKNRGSDELNSLSASLFSAGLNMYLKEVRGCDSDDITGDEDDDEDDDEVQEKQKPIQ